MTKARYHHGDLANALVDEALRAVEEGGAEALSMRDLAARLGVSRAAPYRHFEDRDALLAVVAARGFEALGVDYEAALTGPGDGRARLEAASRAFFAFAYRRPGLYRLMFESDLLGRDPTPEVLMGPANASFHQIWRAIQGAYPDANESEVKMRAILLMSTGHGFLALDQAGRFKRFMYEPMTHEEMVEAVMRTAMQYGPI